jgi:hypothetical protein
VLRRLAAAPPAEALLNRGGEFNVFDAFSPVADHFSMHTGQIILLTKRYAPGRVQFYEDAGGLAVPRF